MSFVSVMQLAAVTGDMSMSADSGGPHPAEPVLDADKIPIDAAAVVGDVSMSADSGGPYPAMLVAAAASSSYGPTAAASTTEGLTSGCGSGDREQKTEEEIRVRRWGKGRQGAEPID